MEGEKRNRRQSYTATVNNWACRRGRKERRRSKARRDKTRRGEAVRLLRDEIAGRSLTWTDNDEEKRSALHYNPPTPPPSSGNAICENEEEERGDPATQRNNIIIIKRDAARLCFVIKATYLSLSPHPLLLLCKWTAKIKASDSLNSWSCREV